jgi:hypothetical protein
VLPSNTPGPTRGTAIETPPAEATTLTTPGVVRTTARTTVPEPMILGLTLAPRICGTAAGAVAGRAGRPAGTAGERRGTAAGDRPTAGRAAAAVGGGLGGAETLCAQAAKHAAVPTTATSVRTMAVHLCADKSESGRAARTTSG